ncbi:hypothetical protein LEMLEM_LOCUS733 [Lemmus lemmus]
MRELQGASGSLPKEGRRVAGDHPGRGCATTASTMLCSLVLVTESAIPGRVAGHYFILHQRKGGSA